MIGKILFKNVFITLFFHQCNVKLSNGRREFDTTTFACW